MICLKRSAAAWLLVIGLVLGSASPARAEDAPVELRVMAFNVWLGGDQVNYTRVVDAIRAADADIVCLQEIEGGTLALAEALGWPYASERAHVISRYPLFTPPGAEPGIVLAELVPGRFVAVADVHLPSDPYGPYEARDGKTAEEVLALEQETRLWAIEPVIAALTGFNTAGIPGFVAGDFNAPSHLDWIEATVNLRPQMRFPLAWPVTAAMAAAGFRDSYREINPDPKAKPGVTWTLGYPHPNIEANEAVDRIDQVHVLGNATTLASQILGPAGGPDVDIPVSPWPSDHLAVVSTFRVTPAAAPAMLSLDRRAVTIGDPLPVRFNGPSGDGRLDSGSVVLVARAAAAADALAKMPTNNGTDRNSVIVFGSASLQPGAYDALLLDAEGKELARAPIHVLARDAPPEVSTDKDDYEPGEPITVSWKNAPGNRFDWIGLYKAGDPDLYNYIAFIYTGAAIDGSVLFDEAAIGAALEGDDYEARLMRDDAYMLLTARRFTVTTPP